MFDVMFRSVCRVLCKYDDGICAKLALSNGRRHAGGCRHDCAKLSLSLICHYAYAQRLSARVKLCDWVDGEIPRREARDSVFTPVLCIKASRSDFGGDLHGASPRGFGMIFVDGRGSIHSRHEAQGHSPIAVLLREAWKSPVCM